MINTQDQEELFKLIAEYLIKDLECVAIGGTAMMFANYKTTTKDIDLVFKTQQDRTIFIKAIEQLGYKKQAIGIIYDDQRKSHQGKPLMYTRGDERFDLFVKDVFGYTVSFDKKDISQRVDVLGKKEFSLLILSKEELILLKAITGRERDFEDIETILDIEKELDWNTLINNAIKQSKANEWILIDLEAAMQQLKKKYFIKQEFFEKIYAQENSIK